MSTAASIRTPSTQTRPWVLIIALAVGLVGALGIFLAGVVEVDRVHVATPTGAWAAASQHVMQEVVGARKVSDEARCSILQDGANWSVEMDVDGLNSFGGPVRNRVTVSLAHDQRLGFRATAIRASR